MAGIYPCGEGAGYAGGITSAAMDGIKVAETVCRKYAAIKIIDLLSGILPITSNYKVHIKIREESVHLSSFMLEYNLQFAQRL